MTRPLLEVADIFRLYGEHYRNSHPGLATVQYRAMRAIEQCRTAALGGHLQECDHCGHPAISYNSCRNRNCPKCQSSAAARWLEKRENEVLPVPYFHVVFTVPKPITKIALGNQRLIYTLLFRCVSETLLQIAADKKFLGGQIGFLAVLHTWGQNLEFHPHIHCIVPGGALTRQGHWKRSRKKYFLPVAVLSKLFRGKFLAYLNKAFRDRKLNFTGSLAHISSQYRLAAFLKPVTFTDWVVYCKPPFAAPQQLISYLGRYTHRIAISNRRLLSLRNGIVRFRWRDYRDQRRVKILALSADEFIRRFLLHVVPSRFVRIRHYGFLSNRKRTHSLDLIRKQLPINRLPSTLHSTVFDSVESARLCPQCHQGKMITIQILPRHGEIDTS